ERRAAPLSEEWTTHLQRAQELGEFVGDRAGAAEALLETALGERGRGRRGSALYALRQAKELLSGTGAADLEARADLVRGRIDSDRVPEPDVVAALERFHAYTLRSGRRDYLVAACIALG